MVGYVICTILKSSGKMETIRKNIEDERLKSLLMGFGMGIGFGMRLYEVIETPKKQADITNFYEEKNISVMDSFNNSPPDFNEAMKFEIDDNRDVTTVESPIDILNYAGQPESSYDIVQHLKNANCATVEPELPSVSDKEVFQGEEQIVVKDSQESGKLRSNVFECYSCLSTYQSRSASFLAELG